MIYLNIPGLNNSGPEHWQTKWETRFDSFSRVEQDNWNVPNKQEWVSRLDQNIRQLSAPSILVAHSLGCITAIHWLNEFRSTFIRGAFLVAPADVEMSSKDCFQSFAPVPLFRINIPVVVVASTDDQYCNISRAARWSAYWGGRFVCVGNKGHINAASGLSDWEEGWQLLLSLRDTVQMNNPLPLAV